MLGMTSKKSDAVRKDSFMTRSEKSGEGVFVRIFEFHAKPGREREFEKIYGPEGDWAQLFRRSEAFIRTELHCDRETKGRYVTVDYFASLPEFEKLLAEHRADYEALDHRCAAVRASEKCIGSFLNRE